MRIKLSFKLTGPGLSIRRTTGDATPVSVPDPAQSTPEMASDAPKPIEPASGPGSKVVMLLLAGAAAAIAYWLFTHNH